MSGFDIATIIDKKDKTLPKLYINRPGFDMKYVVSYISHYGGTYANKLNQIFDNERLFDTLSTIKQNETPVQWAIRVRIPLQNLLSAGKFSVYHRYCLFMSYGKGKFVNFNYYRPRIHKSHMAICFDCWKLIKIDDVNPKKLFHFTRQRYVDCLEPKDLMQEHWDHECNKPKTDFGKARIIQRAWKNYKQRPKSLASRAWNALRNDNTPDEKFLGMIPYKVKNPASLDRMKLRYTEEFAEYRKKYNRLPFHIEYEIKTFKEYIIPYDWIGSKKKQLRNRFQKQLLEFAV